MQKSSRAITLLLVAIVIAGIVYLIQPDSSEEQLDSSAISEQVNLSE